MKNTVFYTIGILLLAVTLGIVYVVCGDEPPPIGATPASDQGIRLAP
jgi:hypothetical protein